MDAIENLNQKNQEDLLNMILEKLEGRENLTCKKYYRNKDLKQVFGISPNTITKYREDGILPYTMLGEIYLYPIAEVDKILKINASFN